MQQKPTLRVGMMSGLKMRSHTPNSLGDFLNILIAALASPEAESDAPEMVEMTGRFS